MTGRATSAVLGASLIAVVAGLGTPQPAAADHAPALLGLTPVDEDGTYFELTASPGDVRQLRVEAANFGNEEMRARTYAADVYSIVNGGFGAELFGEPAAGTTEWLSYRPRELTLGPREAVVIDFAVAVPDDAAPGEYVTALVIENADPVRGEGSVAFEQINRNAIAVAITVPGPRRTALEMGGVRHQTVGDLSIVSFEVENPGDTHLRPAGRFVLRDRDGTEVTARDVRMDSVYAGTGTLLEVPVAPRLAPGDYCAVLTLSDEEAGATASVECLNLSIASDGSGPLSGVPALGPAAGLLGGWGVLAIGLALLAGIAALAWFAARRRRRQMPPAQAEAVRAAARPASDFGDQPTGGDAEVATMVRILRRVLRTHPGVRRAWISRRESGLLLALEAPPGTSPAELTGLSHAVKQHGEREVGRPLSVRVVAMSGAGPIARVTRDAAPFYVRPLDP